MCDVALQAPQPVLSVAVPSYNVEAYLERGLNSFADARFNDVLEVIVVNDGSTDSTPAIAQRFVDAFPRIFRLVNKENGGHGSAVNTGVRLARGTYFRVVDGDDWVHTDNLVALIELLQTEIAKVGDCEPAEGEFVEDDLAKGNLADGLTERLTEGNLAGDKPQPLDIVVDMRREVDMSTMQGPLISFPDTIDTSHTHTFEDVCTSEDVENAITIHTLTARTELIRDHAIAVREGIFYVDYEYIVKVTAFARTVRFVPLEVYQYLVGNASQSVAAGNWVKRYQHHETVVKELLAFASKGQFSASVASYIERKVRLIINTHYKVLLIFDTNRIQGAQRAAAFRTWLTAEYPNFARLTNPRYRVTKLLHMLGFDAVRLDRLMGR